MKWLFLLLPVALSSFVAWFFWGPVLGFLTSLIPATAEYAWIGKLLCVIIVGWFGGVTIPLFVFFVGLWMAANLID